MKVGHVMTCGPHDLMPEAESDSLQLVSHGPSHLSETVNLHHFIATGKPQHLRHGSLFIYWVTRCNSTASHAE